MRFIAKYVPGLVILGTVTMIYAAPDAAKPAEAPPLSVAEMQAKVTTIQSGLDEDQRFVMHLQAVAKKEKDVLKLNCVNDKIVELKAQRNIADNTTAQLNTALSSNSDTRYTLYADLTGTSNQVKDLREQAQACIGEPELFKQEAGVTVTHPEFPDEPPQGPDQTQVEVEPPGYASPFH